MPPNVSHRKSYNSTHDHTKPYSHPRPVSGISFRTQHGPFAIARYGTYVDFADRLRQLEQVLSGRVELVMSSGLEVEPTGAPMERLNTASLTTALRVTPDLAEFAASEDVTELAGGETKTDRDGWFAVSMARA